VKLSNATALAALMLLALYLPGASHAAAAEQPNIILIFTDDQGYGDIGVYGGQGFKTPNLDKMAEQGVRFTDFYVNCPVCSGSRAALLTGCHYQRVSMRAVMFPRNMTGLHPDEVTIADVLKTKGYATACIGKWHQGHREPFLPTKQGFDYYYGVPYSNDMTIDPKNAKLAKNITLRQDMTIDKIRSEKIRRNWVPLMRGVEVIEYPADQATLTKRYTQETIKFIKQNKDKPFFVYLPHTQPHLPMYVSKEFKGRTKNLFGDVMEEIDWSVGQILDTLKKLNLDEKTLVIFTTDNGTRSGSSGKLRARKASIYEGGVRVPCIVRWPGKVPQGKVVSEIVATIDLLPTLAKLTGAKVPNDRIIDGKDIWPLMSAQQGAKSPHEFYTLLHGGGSVRSGQWKYYPTSGQQKRKRKDAAKPKQQTRKGPAVQLYDLNADLSETTNVADKHPEVVKRLHAAYIALKEDIRKNRRPAGTVDDAR